MYFDERRHEVDIILSDLLIIGHWTWDAGHCRSNLTHSLSILHCGHSKCGKTQRNYYQSMTFVVYGSGGFATGRVNADAPTDHIHRDEDKNYHRITSSQNSYSQRESTVDKNNNNEMNTRTESNKNAKSLEHWGKKNKWKIQTWNWIQK